MLEKRLQSNQLIVHTNCKKDGKMPIQSINCPHPLGLENMLCVARQNAKKKANPINYAFRLQRTRKPCSSAASTIAFLKGNKAYEKFIFLLLAKTLWINIARILNPKH